MHARLLAEIIEEVWLLPDGRVRLRRDGEAATDRILAADDPHLHALLRTVPLSRADYAAIFGAELAARYRPEAGATAGG